MRTTLMGLNRLTVSAILLASFGAQANVTSFVPAGGSCMSQSSWTQKALEQTDVIATTLQALKADPNCRGIVESIGNGKLLGRPGELQAAQAAVGENGEMTYRTETVMQELAALRDVLIQKNARQSGGQLNTVVAEATVDAMTAISEEKTLTTQDAKLKNLKGRLQNASSQGVQILNSLFQTLPQHEVCMQKRPDLTAALVMGGIKVASAFAMGDMGMSVQVAEMAGNFLNYLQDVKFSQIKKSLNEQKLWSELSCLTETVQASYCAVQDGFGLLKIQRQFLNKSVTNSPLEGFYLMSREIPAITNWLDVTVQKLALQDTSTNEEITERIGKIDQFNFSDESVAGSHDSVRTSLVNTRSYLSRLYNRLQSRADSQPMLLSLVDTISRLDRILLKLKDLDKEAKAMGILLKNGNYRLSDLSNYGEAEREAQLGKFTDFVRAVVKEFNVKTSGSSLLNSRMATYVRHEYDVRLKNEDFSKYTNQLLVSARGTVLEKLKEYQKFNIAEAQADLSQASVINMNNMEQLEKMVAVHLEDYLVHLNKRAGHSFRCAGERNTWASTLGFDVGPILRGDCTFYAPKQDLNDEAENIRAKICIQTLGFGNYTRFVGLCRGAVLKSSQVSDGRSVKDLPLEFSYNELYKKRWNSESLGTQYLGIKSAQRFSQVCLLRDYFRNNFVHWLTLKYQEKR